jgi:hypothetical protein
LPGRAGGAEKATRGVITLCMILVPKKENEIIARTANVMSRATT